MAKAATPKATPNVPINYEAQFEQQAADIAKRLATPSGDRIRFNSNRAFITPDGQEGEILLGVIIDFVSANLFYDGPFDRDNPQPPGCFAIGEEPSLLVPSKNSPNRQAETCSSCPQNQFGSAPTGKGKACKNTRLVAFIPSIALDSPEEEAPMWIMSVPPASLKAYDGYVAALASRHKRPPAGVLTEVTLDRTQTYASPRFTIVRPLLGPELNIIMPRREEALTRLSAEPDVSQYVPPKAAPRGAGAAQAMRARR